MDIKNTEVYGFQAAFRGMRNPMNSHYLSDSKIKNNKFILGEADKLLAQKLIRAGPEHSKFLRQIQVWADFDMPRYWWAEFDTYKFNTKNSCSTMHRLLNNKNQITLEMFVYKEEDIDLMNLIIKKLNEMRVMFLLTGNTELLIRAKRLLPEGYLQLRTVNTNYAEIRNMKSQRKNHILKEEWVGVFCNWVDTLPYANDLLNYRSF